MPDPNKLKILADAGYVVRKVCGLCVHSVFVGSFSTFGSCGLLTYEHVKHGKRNLTVHAAGRCFDPDRFEWDRRKLDDLLASGFERFVEREETNGQG